ncbi:hypothetical protein [Mycolicibacterium sp. HS_4_1]
MQKMQEIDLAWSLVEAAKHELDRRERNHVFVSIGAGDPFTAIRILVSLIADKRIPLHPLLVQLCNTWLQAYALHADHERLRLLVDEFTVPGAQHRPRVINRSLSCTEHSAASPVSGPERSAAYPWEIRPRRQTA